MRLVSTIALGAALAMGGIAMLGTSPALAKKDEPKQHAMNFSKGVREAVVAAQAALGKNDAAGAQAALAPVLGSLGTPDDKLFVGQLLYQTGQQTKDVKTQAQGIDLMIGSGSVSGQQLTQMYLARGQIAYQGQDYKTADLMFDQAIKAGGASQDVYALQAETKAKLGQPQAALDAIQAASDNAKAAGQKLPADFYARAISIGYNAKLGPQTEKLSGDWLRAYPTPDNWRDSLQIFRELNHPDADYDLDISRLQRTAGALKGEKDYYDYASQLYQRFPGEAKTVIEEGIAKGFLNGGAGGDIQSMLATVNKRIVGDKADLPGATAAAPKAKDGKSAFNTANAYLGYGDWAKAIDLYKLSLTKGGVDANMVNTRLGMALFRSGDKAGAKQVFASITGPRASLARYWTIWIDQQG